MLKTWKFAVTTPQGIYQGELTGEQEPGETNDRAMQVVSDIVKGYLKSQGVSNILACFVSDSALHIDAPETELIALNTEEEFQI